MKDFIFKDISSLIESIITFVMSILSNYCSNFWGVFPSNFLTFSFFHYYLSTYLNLSVYVTTNLDGSDSLPN